MQIVQYLEQINVQDFVIPIEVTGQFVSWRFDGDPLGASRREARYNTKGVDCFYIADSVKTANSEVRYKFENKVLHSVKPTTIYAFDAQRFAQKFTLTQYLTGAEEDGGYSFCQELAGILVSQYSLSGVAYPSRQMALADSSGMCIALLPQQYQLNDGKLEIFEPRIDS